MGNEVISALKMNKIQYDKVSFVRTGSIKQDVELKIGFKHKIIENDSFIRVILGISGSKSSEYDFEVVISGYFTIDDQSEVDNKTLIETNAVSILMPYLRSQISNLTAQPGVECVVLPPFNINNILNKNK